MKLNYSGLIVYLMTTTLCGCLLGWSGVLYGHPLAAAAALFAAWIIIALVITRFPIVDKS